MIFLKALKPVENPRSKTTNLKVNQGKSTTSDRQRPGHTLKGVGNTPHFHLTVLVKVENTPNPHSNLVLRALEPPNGQNIQIGGTRVQKCKLPGALKLSAELWSFVVVWYLWISFAESTHPEWEKWFFATVWLFALPGRVKKRLLFYLL